MLRQGGGGAHTLNARCTHLVWGQGPQGGILPGRDIVGLGVPARVRGQEVAGPAVLAALEGAAVRPGALHDRVGALVQEGVEEVTEHCPKVRAEAHAPEVVRVVAPAGVVRQRPHVRVEEVSQIQREVVGGGARGSSRGGAIANRQCCRD